MSRFLTLTVAPLLAFAMGTLALAQESSSTSNIKLEDVTSAPERRWSGEWKFELKGAGFSEGRDEGAAAEFFFESKFKYRFTSMLTGYFEPEAQLFSGRAQERYDNDTYESRIGLGAGLMSFTPVKYVDLRGGVISQEFVDHPLLISQHRAFPGLQQIISTETQPVTVRVMAQQLIPTSYSLNFERSTKEPLPSFQTQSLHVTGKHPGLAEWEVAAGHFNFSRMPDKVAYQSAQMGNTVFGGEAAPGAKLAYGFDGVFWKAEACLCLDGAVQFGAKYFGLLNSNAPSVARDAQMIGGGPRFKFGDHELELRYYNYFAESDSTVARYSRGTIGNTNRVGDILEAEFYFKKQGFKVKGQYVNARTLANTPNQQTLIQYYLGVETDYAPF